MKPTPPSFIFNLNEIPQELLDEQYRDYLSDFPLSYFGDPYTTDKNGNYVAEAWNDKLADDEIINLLKSRRHFKDFQIHKKEGWHGISIYILIADINQNTDIIVQDMDHLGYFVGRETITEMNYQGQHWKQIQFEPKEQLEIPKEEIINFKNICHWTPFYNIALIQREGLKPKHEHKYFNYPPRVYFFFNMFSKEEIVYWGQKLCQFNENPQNNGDYVLIQLKQLPPNIHLYYDPNLQNAIFTKDIVPIEYLEPITRKKFK